MTIPALNKVEKCCECDLVCSSDSDSCLMNIQDDLCSIIRAVEVGMLMGLYRVDVWSTSARCEVEWEMQRRLSSYEAEMNSVEWG